MPCGLNDCHFLSLFSEIKLFNRPPREEIQNTNKYIFCGITIVGFEVGPWIASQSHPLPKWRWPRRPRLLTCGRLAWSGALLILTQLMVHSSSLGEGRWGVEGGRGYDGCQAALLGRKRGRDEGVWVALIITVRDESRHHQKYTSLLLPL